ncbi:hypothetical protein TWF281_006844 [Arthrobotrys megalospora]
MASDELNLTDLNLHLLPREEVCYHFKSLLTTTSHSTITASLLTAIQSGVLPPSIFKIWFSVSPTTPTILSALSQTFSTSIRVAAIRVLWKKLSSNSLPKWQETWDSIGGVPGLLKIFSEASVAEVKLLCKVIPWSTKLSDPPEKREAYTLFFKCLLSDRFTDVEWKNPDQRKLDRFYETVARACTAEFIEQQAALDDTWAYYEWQELRDKLVWKGYEGYLEYARLRNDLRDFPRAEEWANLFVELYPTLQTTVDGISAGLKFSPELQEKTQRGDWRSKIRNSTRANYAKKPGTFVEGIIYPLTRRAYKRRSSPEVVKRILDLSIAFFEDNKKQAASIKRGTHDLLEITVIAWGTSPETFDPYLRTFLKMYYSDSHPGFENYTTLLPRVPATLSFQLLKICMKETRELDIENDEDIAKSKITFGSKFLNLFPPETAFEIYSRFKTATGDIKFINESGSQTVLSLRALDESHADPDIWQIYMLQKVNRQQEAEELALKCFTARKAKAQSSSTPQLRATRAREAICYTIASGSLTLYREAMEWIRQRFIRDSFVVSYIFENETQEALKLVIGVPDNLAGITVGSLSKRISESNKLLETLYDTAFVAAKEPSFNLRNWTRTLKLIPYTIEQRTKESEGIKNTLKLSDKAVFEVLWKDLIQLIIKIEEKGLQTWYEKLSLDTTRGVLHHEQRYAANLVLKESTPLSTHLFFDNLSKARNALWQELRLATHTTPLPSVFPLGLPLQSLIGPYTIAHPNLDQVAPYLYSRAKSAVYLPSDAITPIPSNDETWTSMGLFIDDYNEALRILVPTCLDRIQRKERIHPIFMHGVTTLSSRLSSPGAAVFWKHWLPLKFASYSWARDSWNRLITEILDEENLDLWPNLPSISNTTEEWNPQENFLLPSRELEVSYLDLSLHIGDKGYKSGTIHTKLQKFTPRSPDPDDIWSAPRLTRAKNNPKIREAQIFAALSYLAFYFSLPPLTSPIPHRYPSVTLKPTFRPKTIQVFNAAIEALTAHKQYIPPQLLQTLISSALKVSKEVPELTKLIQLLATSDTPSLATPFSISVILNHPDASSWHRYLLQPRYLASLPKSEASKSLIQFGEGIIHILEEQEKQKNTTATMDKPEAQEQQQVYVKITTIKHLSNLLTDASISPTTAIEILSLLAPKCTHIDVRKSLLDSFISILMETTDKTIATKVIDSLKFLIPIAGNFNERNPISEELWLQAEEKKDVEVLDIQLEHIGNGILLSTIFTTGTRPRNQFRWKDLYLKNISVPILQELKKHTGRYISIFLAGHGFSDSEIEEVKAKMVVVPGTWSAWYKGIGGRGLEGAAWYSREILEELAEYMIFRISLPEKLVELGKKLNEKEWKGKPGVRFWNVEYGHDTYTVNFPVDLRMLKSRRDFFEETGIDANVVREEMMKYIVGGLYFGV